MEYGSPGQKVILRNWAPPLNIPVSKNSVAIQQKLVCLHRLDEGKFRIPSERKTLEVVLVDRPPVELEKRKTVHGEGFSKLRGIVNGACHEIILTREL